MRARDPLDLPDLTTRERMANDCSCGTSTGTLESVKEYYGKILHGTEDLKTNACTTSCGAGVPKRVKKVIAECHEEVVSKYYGCGLVFPEAVEGCRVLDLGSGSGRDCFVLSKLVGPQGFVTGVDMTQGQLDLAVKHIDYHTSQFGYSKPNVEFRKGYIERLKEAGIEDESQDIVISNCVINLSPDKRAVIQEAYRVLKPGGEMYFSDVYSDRQVTEEARKNEMLWGECISGALQWEELIEIASETGFSPPMLVEVSPIGVNNAELERLLGGVQFCSATYRLFKVGPSEQCKDTDAVMEVQYKGSIPDHPTSIKLTRDLEVRTSCATLLPASIAQVLVTSRLAPHFTATPSQQDGSQMKYKSISELKKVSLQLGEAIDSRRPSGVTSKREIGNCPSMGRVVYYQEKQIAKAQVINTGLVPTFTLKPSNDLVRTICPKCLNSSIKGEVQVDLGRLAREMAEVNITLLMSWDLHSSRKVKCKEGGLTWLYSTESNWLSIVERPELVEVVTEPDSVDSVINKTETSGGGNRVHSQALLTIVSLAIPVTLLCG